MAKILLVEDDNNLREIYEARLMAEGYDIVSARDGEEALTVAMKEKPDLIISDVMMPKISGFDMLDILRSTEETKHIKVIMMTALSQAEDKARAEKLGADRYLVKSQVTLEDVAKVAKDVLDGVPENGATPVAQAPAEPVAPAVPPMQDTTPVVADPAPVVAAPVVEEPVVVTAPAEPVAPAVPPMQDASATTPIDQQLEHEEQAIAQQIQADMHATEQSTEIPAGETTVMPSAETTTLASNDRKVIEPPQDTPKPDLNALLAQEEEKERQQASTQPTGNPQMITPTPTATTPPTSTSETSIDPNSIAL